MIIANESLVRSHLDWPQLIDALADMFRSGCSVGPRVHHELAVPNAPDGTLLLMPAWKCGRFIGVKVVTVFPGNAALGLPSVSASYLLFDASNGAPLAFMEASGLTAKRTAAASALAARYLARPDAARLLLVGTGRVARELACAHAAVRTIQSVAVWGRDFAKAERLACELSEAGRNAVAVPDLHTAAGDADIISCATLSSPPLLQADWIVPGTHVDLVGAFKPSMREVDERLMGRASIFVDTRTGALAEAGDIVIAIERGAITPENIRADLAELVAGIHPGRQDRGDITVFKSVGTASEDLAAAVLVYEQLVRESAAANDPIPGMVSESQRRKSEHGT